MSRLARLVAVLAVSAPLGAQVAVHSTAEAGFDPSAPLAGIRRAAGWNLQTNYNLVLKLAGSRLTVGG
ncbi:MAG: hypothetical protein ABI647_02660 [Gemmatimonadota bacterium]